jgi:hypothetical protein
VAETQLPGSSPAPFTTSDAVPPAVSVPVSAPVATPESSPFNFAEFAKTQGYDTTGITGDEQIAKTLFDELRAARAVANYAQQQPNPAEKAPEPAAEEEWTPESYFKSKWDVPQRDPQWEQLIAAGIATQDASGRFVANRGYEALAPQIAAMNAYETKRRERLEEFLANPYQRTYDTMVEALDRRYARPEQFRETLAERDVDAYAAQVEDSLATHLYANPQNVPQFGTPQFAANLTEYGRKFFGQIDRGQQLGINQRNSLIQYALETCPVPQPATTATPAAAPGKPAAAPTTPAVPAPSFLDDAMAKAGHRASGGAPPAAAGDPKQLSAQEVRTLFSRKALQQT